MPPMGRHLRHALTRQHSLIHARRAISLRSSLGPRSQIKTIYTLVEDVTVEHGGAGLHKKLLFLTNKQARAMNVSDMDRIFNALEIAPRPKLVVNLFGSFAYAFGSPSMNNHWRDQPEGW